ncbi:MAG: hypothetical protein JW881_18725 [Spirochaetales bacterium]|nr:hypothetical protein [Spirochaetales bacterium]
MMKFGKLSLSIKNSEVTQILGIHYLHIGLNENEDLYVTKYGIPFYHQLEPRQFLTDRDWFQAHSDRLSGTSCTYRVRTKEVNGVCKDVVIKWNRMGQDIPGAEDFEEFAGAEFNSPFEEFSLVMELRNTKYESPGRIITQKPLAVYVPNEHVELWESGRREYKMRNKIAAHEEIELNMYRSYVMIYEWVKGIDLAKAHTLGIVDRETMKAFTLHVDKELRNKGFHVRDRKPHHIIIRPGKDRALKRTKDGSIPYALVDFELLERTTERDRIVKNAKRTNYLRRQSTRFSYSGFKSIPPYLKSRTIMGVDYIYGHAEFTHGALWIVGRDPELFDYFLPERWEKTPRKKLSATSEIYHTVTKDNIHLVWKVSRVGLLPHVDPLGGHARRIIEHGYNSPFEEVSIALELNKKGIQTIYPRAIYMTGNAIDIDSSLSDKRRYIAHSDLRNPDDTPILREDRDYLLIWGYWNGPDDMLALYDGNYYSSVNAIYACKIGLISKKEYKQLLQRQKKKLFKAGFEDLNMKGSHLLLSLDSRGNLLHDIDKKPAVIICNFELIRRIRPAGRFSRVTDARHFPTSGQSSSLIDMPDNTREINSAQ